MIVPTEWIALLILLGSAQGLFLALLLVGRREERKANGFLALLLALFSYTMLIVGVWSDPRFRELILRFPHVSGTVGPLPFLFGPLHYGYVRQLVAEKKLQGRDLLHLVPCLVCVLVLLPYYVKSGDEKREFLMNLDSETSLLAQVIVLSRLVHVAIYTVCSYRMLGRVDPSRRVKGPVFPWVRGLTGVLGFLWILAFGLVVFDSVSQLSVPTGEITMVYLSGGVYALGYLGIKRHGVFVPGESAGAPRSSPEASPVASGRPKYSRSGLDREDAQRCLAELALLMEKEERFRDPELTLGALAEELGRSSNHVSQAINQVLGKNLHEFVNDYRVRAAKRVLESEDESEDLKLLAVAYRVGFGSKSAFNAAFKKQTGLTPSEFRARRRSG